MMIRQKLLEKALNDACTYIHDDGYNGCPSNYDNKTVTNEKMKECRGCYYYCNGSYCNSLQPDPFYEEYKKKSIQCWKEYFLRGDEEPTSIKDVLKKCEVVEDDL